MINLLRWDQHTRGICELISEVRTCAATAVEAAAHVDGGASLRCLLFTTANIFHLSPSRCLGVPLPDRALASKSTHRIGMCIMSMLIGFMCFLVLLLLLC